MLKSYIFSVIRTAIMVTVLRKRLRPWSQSLEKAVIIAAVLIQNSLASLIMVPVL